MATSISELSEGKKRPHAYFLTFHTYGTWLRGKIEGSVDRWHRQFDSPFLSPDANANAEYRHRMKQDAMTLDGRQRGVVAQTIQEVCKYRCWQLLELNVRTNHVHVIVNGETTPEKMLHDFKAYSTRRLRSAKCIAQDRRVWSRHGSTRYLWDERSVARACEYVRDGQGNDLPSGSDW